MLPRQPVLLGERFDARLAQFDERELGGDEEAVDEHQQQRHTDQCESVSHAGVVVSQGVSSMNELSQNAARFQQSGGGC